MSMVINSCIRTVKCFMFVVGVCEYGVNSCIRTVICLL